MKKLFLLSTALIFTFFAFSASLILAGENICKVFIPLEEGVTLRYENFNGKEKLTGSDEMTIQSIKEVGENIEIGILAKTFDKKGELTSEQEMEYACVDGNFKMDLKSYLQQDMLEAYEDMEMEIEQSELVIPSSIAVGESLPDANLTMKIKANGSVMMTMNIDITDRKVEGIEEITTPAGTFSAMVLTESQETKMMFMNRKSKTKTWLVEELGAVRSETYTDKDRLEFVRILSAIK